MNVEIVPLACVTRFQSGNRKPTPARGLRVATVRQLPQHASNHTAVQFVRASDAVACFRNDVHFAHIPCSLGTP